MESISPMLPGTALQAKLKKAKSSLAVRMLPPKEVKRPRTRSRGPYLGNRNRKLAVPDSRITYRPLLRNRITPSWIKKNEITNLRFFRRSGFSKSRASQTTYKITNAEYGTSLRAVEARLEYAGVRQ